MNLLKNVIKCIITWGKIIIVTLYVNLLWFKFQDKSTMLFKLYRSWDINFFSNLAIVYVSAKNLISKLQEPLEFNASELQKHFKMGDHVKVISGRYDGDTGLIVRVNANFVVLFSDLTMHEVFWHFLNLY